MTTLTLVLLGVLVLVAAFLAYVAAKPGDFRIERSASVRGSADDVFARVDDLREFNAWNPFAAADPGAALVCPGKTRGEGAACESSGRSSRPTRPCSRSRAKVRRPASPGR